MSRDREARRARSKGSTLRLCVLVALLFGLIAMTLLRRRGAKSAMAMPNPPELWNGKVLAACPQKAMEPARELAANLMALAESKRERAPFFPQAGVAAVSLYREASACLAAAGQSAEAGGSRRRTERRSLASSWTSSGSPC